MCFHLCIRKRRWSLAHLRGRHGRGRAEVAGLARAAAHGVGKARLTAVAPRGALDLNAVVAVVAGPAEGLVEARGLLDAV